VLPAVFERGSVDFVIAFGTAGFLDPVPYNGSAVVGSTLFIYNPYPHNGKTNPESNWVDDENTGKIIHSPIATPDGEPNADRYAPHKRRFASLFANEDFRHAAEARFLKPPMGAAEAPIIMAAYKNLGLGVINITDYDDYIWADHEAIDAYRRLDASAAYPIASVETTHCIIRLQSEAPFLYVSGIVDRLGYFDRDVAPRVYAQNFVGAHNAGVAVAWLLPEIVRLLEQDGDEE
jgi:hypothetical protein